MSSRSSGRKLRTEGERVQKVLANTGLASRREIDRLIQAGRIVIDGRPAIPGDRLTGTEKVFVDGRQIRLPDRSTAAANDVLMYHKPVGEITTRRDPEGRPTVFDALPKPARGRWITIGRLDINTSGLLLLTTDGTLAHRLMHPSYQVEREYAVRVRGQLNESQLHAITTGVTLDDGPAKFESVLPMQGGKSNSWYQVLLLEGRNREVRRVFEAVGCTVSRLMRVRYGPINLGRLARGKYRYLERAEAERLYQTVADATEPATS